MNTKIGNYTLSKDRSTVYYNNIPIYKSDAKRLSPGLYFIEDNKVCFSDTKTGSIYHAKENGVKRIYNNVHFFSIDNLNMWYGNTEEGKTVFLRLIDETYFKKVFICTKDYTDYCFKSGYYLNENDFEILMFTIMTRKFCFLSHDGIYDFPCNYKDIHIHYNYVGERIFFCFDDELKQLKVLDKNGEKVLYKQCKEKMKRFDGTTSTWYPPLTIQYRIDDNDIIQIKIGTVVVYYDNHMPITYQKIQTPLKQYKESISQYLFYPEDGSKKAFVIKKLFENSGYDIVLNSNSEGDTSVNHIVKIGDTNYEWEYALLAGSFNASHYLIQGVKLISLLASTEYAIKNRLWDVSGFSLFNIFLKKNYTREVLFLKSFYDISDGELFWFLKTQFLDTLNVNHSSIQSANFKDYEKLMDNILLETGYYTEHPSAWKNEFTLYRYIKELIPDTVYQAQPKWLKPQSLDIYIESKSIGIEYQGVQHFHPVDYFGGENGYLETVQRDKKKMQKCNENGVQLLYWNYQETVTKLSVEDFLLKNRII